MLRTLTTIVAAVSVLMTLLSLGCKTSDKSLPFGVPAAHSGYVPARIAVLPCRVWPNGARFQSLPMSNVKDLALKETCKRFDEFVIQGFSDQPYMRGFSPKWVLQLLDEANKESILTQIDKNWAHREDDCTECTTPTAFYIESILDRPRWRLWLSEFSQSVRYADAVLIPFVMYAYDTKYIDRGLAVSRRAAGVSMLLIDTNQGYLLWSGGRDSFTTAQELVARGATAKADFPEWDLLFGRLFVEDIWKSFPGRQVYK